MSTEQGINEIIANSSTTESTVNQVPTPEVGSESINAENPFSTHEAAGHFQDELKKTGEQSADFTKTGVENFDRRIKELDSDALKEWSVGMEEVKAIKKKIDELEKQKQEKIKFGKEKIENLAGESSDTAENISPTTVAKKALEKMPEGKQGIVLGVGDNTKKWSEKGWKTLDIDSTTGADFIADANYLENVAMPGSQDFLYSEYIRFDPKGIEGVAHARILQQANKVLKMNGEFIIKSANFENVPNTTVPQKEAFLKLLKEHGFEVVTETGEPERFGENKMAQEITYFAKKTAEGYDPKRAESKEEKTQKNSDMPEKEIPKVAKNPEKAAQLEDVKSWAGKSFYERLGISETANEEEIAQAFRELSKKYHPDTVSGDEATRMNYEEVQKLLGEAKNTLNNPQERAKYDSSQKTKTADSAYSGKSSTTETRQQKYEPEPTASYNNENQETSDFMKYAQEKFNNPAAILEIQNEISRLSRLGYKREFLMNSLIKAFEYRVKQPSFWFDSGVYNARDVRDNLINLGVSGRELNLVLNQAAMENFSKQASVDVLFVADNEDALKRIADKIKLYKETGISSNMLLNSLGQENKSIVLKAAEKFRINLP